MRIDLATSIENLAAFQSTTQLNFQQCLQAPKNGHLDFLIFLPKL